MADPMPADKAAEAAAVVPLTEAECESFNASVHECLSRVSHDQCGRLLAELRALRLVADASDRWHDMNRLSANLTEEDIALIAALRAAGRE